MNIGHQLKSKLIWPKWSKEYEVKNGTVAMTTAKNAIFIEL